MGGLPPPPPHAPHFFMPASPIIGYLIQCYLNNRSMGRRQADNNCGGVWGQEPTPSQMGLGGVSAPTQNAIGANWVVPRYSKNQQKPNRARHDTRNSLVSWGATDLDLSCSPGSRSPELVRLRFRVSSYCLSLLILVVSQPSRTAVM